MTAEIAQLPPRHITVADGAVRITDLTSTDPDLVAVVADASDPESIVQRVLSVGARALGVANASVDMALVENSFAALAARMGELVDAGHNQLRGTASELFDDPDTGVKAALARWSTDLTQVLDTTFDPARTDSVLGKLHLVLAANGESQLAATRRLLNPDADDSPLSRLAASVREQVATVLDALGRLAEQVSAEKAATAAAAALERSAVKGMAYEVAVGRAVTDIAAARGDVATACGTATGVSGDRVGDHLVAVADGGSYVLEAKDRAKTLPAILAELDAAAVNREADAAIAVFSSQEHSPTSEPVTVFGTRVIAVYDKGDPDPTALALACAWARAVAVGASRPEPGEGIDLDRVRAAVDAARDALARAAVIRRAHTLATKKISEAGEVLGALTGEVSAALAAVDTAIADTPVGSSASHRPPE